ncbi:MAG: glycosyltransferase family 39 protein, partial [Bacteroidales bacterium]|nr:glycosyltransferase family 39 protein [Bacteroidales bacterium]
MKKKNNLNKIKTRTNMKSKRGKPITASDEKSSKIYYPAILIFIALFFYSNTLFNEYAFDDFTYIVDNSYIQQGFSGIGKLMSSDALESYIKSKGGSVNDLGGGRYRPLSLVSFAIEYQFFKENPFISHLVNVLLYMLTAFLLFRLLAIHFFRKQLLLAFITTLIFIIHPLHTEVVANIKGRDEIMSLLFMVLSLEYFFRYTSMGRVKEKILSWIFFMLALLSKEYALFFIGFIPAISYVIIKMNRRQAFVSALPFLVITVLYIAIRLGSVGFSTGTVLTITNNPYLLASVPQAWATKIFVLLYYIKLLFVPFPLACDYSYNTFPYRDFTDIWVIASLLIYSSLIIVSVYLLKKRDIASIGLLLFLFPLFFVSNFLMDIGATMGERLIYHSSLGFAMLVALGMVGLSSRIFSNELSKKYFTLALAAICCLISAMIFIRRNSRWKNSFTLFTHDVDVVPKHILVNNNAASMLLKELDKDEDD